MTTVFDVAPEKLIAELSKEFKDKEEFKAPEWAAFAKTGRHKHFFFTLTLRTNSQDNLITAFDRY